MRWSSDSRTGLNVMVKRGIWWSHGCCWGIVWWCLVLYILPYMGESWGCIGYTMVGRWFCTLSQTIATVCHCDISFILCWKLEAFQVQWLQSIARNSLLMDQTCSDAFLGSRSHYESRENRPCLTFAGKRSACWSPGNSFLGPTPIVSAKFANCLIALPHCSQSILVGRIPMFSFFWTAIFCWRNPHILLPTNPHVFCLTWEYCWVIPRFWWGRTLHDEFVSSLANQVS